MMVDTPATIAVLGAGPIGLEAALYGRFLGYMVNVYEHGKAGDNLRRFGHVRLFSPFGMNSSPLGLAALEAQDPQWQPPGPEALLTASEYVAKYLRPLAESDLVIDGLKEQTTVIAVGRDGPLKGELIGSPARAQHRFRLLVEDAGGERIDTADIVIDATGTYGNPNWLGHGGIPAPGERAARAQIEYGLPDILELRREEYAHCHVLLVGAGYSAATNAIALAQLAAEAPRTRVTWITRAALGTPAVAGRMANPSYGGPIPLIAGDRLPERHRIAQAANALAAGSNPRVAHWPGTTVAAIHQADDKFHVHLAGEHAGKVEVDRVIANVGFRPDNSLSAELQVHECYATGGPMKLAAALMASPRTSALSPETRSSDEASAAQEAYTDCLAMPSTSPQALLNPEPSFYILGAKSYGRNSTFLIHRGLEQIRDLFGIIGGRAELDLYKTIRPAKAGK
jgi:hypothetical protein